jgi:hypothetical protein
MLVYCDCVVEVVLVVSNCKDWLQFVLLVPTKKVCVHGHASEVKSLCKNMST